jgi:XapX domain-containing protein
MIKVFVGIILGLLIAIACRWFDIPVPSPPKLTGALLIVAMTVGNRGTDKLIAAKFSAKGPASTQEMCGGPTGDIVSSRHSWKAAKFRDNETPYRVQEITQEQDHG